MPEAYLTLGVALALALLLLCGIAIWTGIARHIELAALERRVRERIMRPQPAAPPFGLVGTPKPRAGQGQRRRRNAAA